MDDFNVYAWNRKQHLINEEKVDETEYEMLGDFPEPKFFYDIYEYLKEKLDYEAVEAGDRMSHFSNAYPLASRFYNDLEKHLNGKALNEVEGGFADFISKLESDPDNKYLKFIEKGDEIRVGGGQQDLQDFIIKYEEQDLSPYKLFSTDDDDRGLIVRISKK